MKVVFFSLEEGAMGGIRRVNAVWREELEKRGVTVTSLFLCRQKEEGGIALYKSPWRFTTGERIKAAPWLLFRRLGDECRLWRGRRRAKRLLRQEKPDAILVSHYLLLDAVPKEALSRTIYHLHGDPDAALSHRAEKRALLCYAHDVTFLFLTEQGSRMGRELGLARVAFLPNPLPWAPCGHEAASCHTAVVHSRMAPEKRLPVAIRLLKKSMDRVGGDCRVILLGEGKEKDAVSAAIGKDERFRLLDAVEDPRPYLNDARFTLNTSRHEGFPMSLLEAQAAGVPAVTYDFGVGVHHLLKHGENALICPLDDEEAFVEALIRLWTDAPLVKTLSQGALKNAERFTRERLFPSFWQLLTSLPLDKTEKSG